MSKILAFSTSSSKTSINKKLASYAANLVAGAEVTLIDMNDYEMTLYSIDKEKEQGVPQKAIEFKQLIDSADGIIMSTAEHNGCFPAVFKNLYDWASRVDDATWGNKPMLLLSTSPGGRGGQTVLDFAASSFPYNKAEVVGTLAVPFFNKVFDSNQGLADEKLNNQLKALITDLENRIAANG